jgi:membrane-associated phospholipid phosphatase
LLYLRAFLLMGALTVCIGLLSGWNAAWLRGCIAVLAMICVAAIVNSWIKLSNHIAFAVFAAIVLLRVEWRVDAPVMVVVPLLAYSRITLGRHSTTEVIGGVCLGSVAGLLVIFCLGALD